MGDIPTKSRMNRIRAGYALRNVPGGLYQRVGSLPDAPDCPGAGSLGIEGGLPHEWTKSHEAPSFEALRGR
jgi:hypothetical protein